MHTKLTVVDTKADEARRIAYAVVYAHQIRQKYGIRDPFISDDGRYCLTEEDAQ